MTPPLDPRKLLEAWNADGLSGSAEEIEAELCGDHYVPAAAKMYASAPDMAKELQEALELARKWEREAEDGTCPQGGYYASELLKILAPKPSEDPATREVGR